MIEIRTPDERLLKRLWSLEELDKFLNSYEGEVFLFTPHPFRDAYVVYLMTGDVKPTSEGSEK